MTSHMNCDGVRRRDFLRVGAVAGTGLTLSNYLRLADAGEVKPDHAQSAIFINLQGGPSHMDTFDLKPESPDEYRGEFNPIVTNVPGIEICEHLPKLAGCADKFCLLRGVTHTLGAHPLGTEYVNTGSRPIPSLEYPGYGAVISKERPVTGKVPPFVSIPNGNQRPGFLGVKYAPLQTGNTPRVGTPFNVRGMTLANGLKIDDIERRQKLLSNLDRTFGEFEKDNQLLDGLDRFSSQAYSMITARETREAFDISKESPEYSGMFGKSNFGASCLLASRLVEHGVRFVSVSYGGWDTHKDNWTKLKDTQLPPLDEGLSALFTGLELKGLLESTVVFVTGEFGRTPKINTERGGRDHYPRNMFMLLAGGGIRGGQVIGASDDKGELPADEGRSPSDVAASFYHALGIDHTKEYHTDTGRPIMIVRDGKVIPEMFA